MTLGTLVVTAILVVIVAAIIISMVRSHRAGNMLVATDVVLAGTIMMNLAILMVQVAGVRMWTQ